MAAIPEDRKDATKAAMVETEDNNHTVSEETKEVRAEDDFPPDFKMFEVPDWLKPSDEILKLLQRCNRKERRRKFAEWDRHRRKIGAKILKVV